jgi:osmoprotectant transport system permease protein
VIVATQRWFGALIVVCLVCCLNSPAVHAIDHIVTVGSKQFTESQLLGELVTLLLRDSPVPVRHQANLGGTQLLWQALLRGDIDCYPEYTGTIAEEILGGRLGRDVSTAKLKQALQVHGVAMTEPLGFNNAYALGMLGTRAEQLHVRRISDLVGRPTLKFGFSSEFVDRGDGWRALQARYGLSQQIVNGMDHEIALRGLANGELDVTDLYTTDPEIAYYKLQVLQDDRQHFPEYFAVILYRADLARQQSQAVRVLQRLEGRITQEAIIEMNKRVKLEKQSELRVAADFLHAQFGIIPRALAQSWVVEVERRTREHVWLVGVSLCAAILVGIPLGVLCARWRRLGPLIIAAIGVLQTIPALALLVLMIPIAGIGNGPAIIAIFIYSVLPIVRNTCSGLEGIPRSLIESADVIGLPRIARLRLVELPLATRSVLAGVKTAAVINVGTATLGALVGAGGYGQPILTGIRLDDLNLILQGAVPAALLAVTIQLAFDLIERRLLPQSRR